MCSMTVSPELMYNFLLIRIEEKSLCLTLTQYRKHLLHHILWLHHGNNFVKESFLLLRRLAVLETHKKIIYYIVNYCRYSAHYRSEDN